MIDTWNVLHQTGILPAESAGIGTQGLVKLIQQSRWGGERITLVCDGTQSDHATTGPKVQAIFTGPHRTADDEIIDQVTRSSSARAILVITSDREIIRSIKSKGAQHLGSAAFLQTLVNDASTPTKKRVRRPLGLSPQLAQEWKEHFGITKEVLEELHNTPMPELQRDDPAIQQKKKEVESIPKRGQKRTVKPDEPTLPADLLEEARRLLGD